MTAKNFLILCEGFYGEKYSGIFLDVMASYLKDKSEAFLDSAARVLVKRFSRIYNKAPGPAEIEKNLDEIYQGIPESVHIPEHEEVSDADREKMAMMLTAFVESKGRKPGPLADLLSVTLDMDKPTATETTESTETLPGVTVTETQFASVKRDTTA